MFDATAVFNIVHWSNNPSTAKVVLKDGELIMVSSDRIAQITLSSHNQFIRVTYPVQLCHDPYTPRTHSLHTHHYIWHTQVFSLWNFPSRYADSGWYLYFRWEYPVVLLLVIRFGGSKEALETITKILPYLGEHNHTHNTDTLPTFSSDTEQLPEWKLLSELTYKLQHCVLTSTDVITELPSPSTIGHSENSTPPSASLFHKDHFPLNAPLTIEWTPTAVYHWMHLQQEIQIQLLEENSVILSHQEAQFFSHIFGDGISKMYYANSLPQNASIRLAVYHAKLLRSHLKGLLPKQVQPTEQRVQFKPDVLDNNLLARLQELNSIRLSKIDALLNR
jgi:hypothetical protein